jgi:hypothetical protein
MKEIADSRVVEWCLLAAVLVALFFPEFALADQFGSETAGFSDKRGGSNGQPSGEGANRVPIPQPVPEVGLLVMVVTGLVGLGVFRYSKRRESRE